MQQCPKWGSFAPGGIEWSEPVLLHTLLPACLPACRLPFPTSLRSLQPASCNMPSSPSPLPRLPLSLIKLQVNPPGTGNMPDLQLFAAVSDLPPSVFQSSPWDLALTVAAGPSLAREHVSLRFAGFPTRGTILIKL